MQRTIMDDSSGATETQVSAISESLAERIGQQKFRIWFKNSTKLTLAGDYLKVGVPNLFIASWIESHFSNEISDAVRSVTGIEAKITFTIDPELTGHQRRTQLDSQASSVATAQNGRQRPRFVTERKHRSAAVNGPHRNKLKLSLDTFVVGSSNELAYNAARLIVKEQESPFNPLFVHGGYGIGKTHLLQGICNGVSGNRPQTNWLYLSAEDFVNQFVLALKTKKLEAFRRRMRHTDLLAIDDFGFKKINQQDAELLYAVVDNRYHNKSTILTSNRAMTDWSSIFPDPLMANAILDRLAHNTHQIIIKGESYRKNFSPKLKTLD